MVPLPASIRAVDRWLFASVGIGLLLGWLAYSAIAPSYCPIYSGGLTGSTEFCVQANILTGRYLYPASALVPSTSSAPHPIYPWHVGDDITSKAAPAALPGVLFLLVGAIAAGGVWLVIGSVVRRFDRRVT